ncbi:flagellin FliC, partial [Escherichia coli]
LDSTGNLTKNGSVTFQQATLEKLQNNNKGGAGGTAIASTIEMGDGSKFTVSGTTDPATAGTVKVDKAFISSDSLTSAVKGKAATVDSVAG